MPHREFLQLSSLAAFGSVIAGIRFWQYATRVAPDQIELKEVHLPIRGLAPAFAGLRIVQISDIHMSDWMDRWRLSRAVRMALSLKPDVVALTGDFLTGRGWSARKAELLVDMTYALRPLAQSALVVSILGNHDHWTNPAAVQRALDQAGAANLNNAVYTLRRGEASLHLAGVDDYNARCARLDAVLDLLPEDGPAILFAHEPDFADLSAKTGRFALQISGHTHGGQVSIPFFGPPVLPPNGKKYPSGLYRVGEMFEYTNRGIGVGSRIIRFNCPPEITLFVLEEDQASASSGSRLKPAVRAAASPVESAPATAEKIHG